MWIRKDVWLKMKNDFETILITGAAGFIGFHLSRRLLEEGHRVVGLDNLNPYYDPKLKKDRLAILKKFDDFLFYKADLKDREAVNEIFSKNRPEVVVNLAAQAGVRYSLKNPGAYIDANIVGFLNVLEGCRNFMVKHLVFASSSSVYGANKKMPFSVHHNVDHPVSLYAATKKSNELMAHTYSHLYGLPSTGLRFFTVYGPWGRPDMALFLFTRAITEGRPIQVFNHGKMRRDFTYIDDIIEGVVRVMKSPPEGNQAWDGRAPDPASSYAPYRLFNIGNNKPVELMEFIAEIEKALNRQARLELLELQPGDVPETYADVSDLMTTFGFRPDTPLEKGIREFVKWYAEYYGLE